MGVEIDVSEVRGLAVTLRAGAARVGARGAAVLRRTAYAMEADAQAGAPVDTGALRSSISTTITGDGRNGRMAAEIGPTVDYGGYVEHGTSTQAGQPYLAPAFDRQIGGFESALAALADDII
ncbi:MAG: HK97-gp10 family putative phage morphogenesis protein [Actinomycetota bacterium]|nr:HK97-gp10 family putative phage morphogenesis protein [Actinomycetota bacterium]